MKLRAALSQERLVAVRWLDPHGSATTTYAKHELPHAPCEITTYGLLLRHDDHGLSIACEQVGDDAFRGHTFILPALILEVIDLGIPKRKIIRSAHPPPDQSQ